MNQEVRFQINRTDASTDNVNNVIMHSFISNSLDSYFFSQTMNSFNSKILNGNILFHSHYIRKHKASKKVLNLYLLKSDLKPIVPFKKKKYTKQNLAYCVF